MNNIKFHSQKMTAKHFKETSIFIISSLSHYNRVLTYQNREVVAKRAKESGNLFVFRDNTCSVETLMKN